MQILHWDKVRVLGRLPRHDEGHAVDAIRGIDHFGAHLVEVFMVSHRWLRPSLDPTRSHPDSPEDSKARAILEFSEWRRQWVKDRHGFLPEIYYWIDYCCIDQKDAAGAVPLLPLWVACCERFLRIETADYDERAWCRLEVLLSRVFSFADHHLAIGAGFRSPWPRIGTRGDRRIFDPRAGKLTNPEDMALLTPLVEMSLKARPAREREDSVSLAKSTVKCYQL